MHLKTKLRQFGLSNRIGLSYSKFDNGNEWWNPSNSKSDVEIGFQLDDNVETDRFWPICYGFQLIIDGFWLIFN